MIADEGPRRKIQPQDGGGGCRTSYAPEPRGSCPGGRYWDCYAAAMAEGARVPAGLPCRPPRRPRAIDCPSSAGDQRRGLDSAESQWWTPVRRLPPKSGRPTAYWTTRRRRSKSRTLRYVG